MPAIAIAWHRPADCGRVRPVMPPVTEQCPLPGIHDWLFRSESRWSACAVPHVHCHRLGTLPHCEVAA
jgi:hypothetical protein